VKNVRNFVGGSASRTGRDVGQEGGLGRLGGLGGMGRRAA